MVVSADVYRPAAIKQLETLAEEVGVTCHPSTVLQKPVDIVETAIEAAKTQFFETNRFKPFATLAAPNTV